MKDVKKKKRKQPLVSDEPMEVDMNLLSPSFKESRKNNRDELIASFDIDKTIPIDKNNIQEVLASETEKFKQLSEEHKDVVKKEIELELLYNYDTTPQEPPKTKYNKIRILLDVLVVILGIILLIVIFK